MSKAITYKDSGIDYSTMDPFKRLAQQAGLETAENISRLNNGEFKEFTLSRGESVYLIEAAKSYFAHVEEGLGTKNLVADAMYELTGKSYYDQIAQDTVAMIVNDMITLGALPLSVAMHLAVGSSDWFKDEMRSRDLINGWKHACNLARCVWGGGETPTLRDVVNPNAVVLSGSAMGLVKPKERLINAKNIKHNDSIILFASSGIHANGLTLARKIAEKLPDSYLTELSDGTSYGEALLSPTNIYVGLIEDCLNAGVGIHYAVNITGHGWRKLMRAVQPFRYVVELLPDELPIFEFIQEFGPVDDYEAYGTFNMSAGFAIYTTESDVLKILEIADSLGIDAIHAGYIENSEDKEVLIVPKNIKYTNETLDIR